MNREMGETERDPFERLRGELSRVPPGEIPPGDLRSVVEKLLAAGWDSLTGDRGGMEGYKLLRRMEQVRWNPPALEFVIERHGGTVLGSTRAELQHWQVDLNARWAHLGKVERRQLRPMVRRISRNQMEELAGDISSLIVAGTQDDRLQWKSTTRRTVRVRLEKVFPSTLRSTLESRRKRLYGQLQRLLTPRGWIRRGGGWWHRP